MLSLPGVPSLPARPRPCRAYHRHADRPSRTPARPVTDCVVPVSDRGCQGTLGSGPWRPARAPDPPGRARARRPAARLGDLGPDPAGPGRRGLGQPQPGAVPDRQELRLAAGACLRRAAQRTGRRGRVVRVVDPVITTCPPCRRTRTTCPASSCGSWRFPTGPPPWSSSVGAPTAERSET